MPLLAEFRSSLENPETPLSFPAEWLLDIFNGGRTDSGLRVSEMTALQVTTAFACCVLVSSAVGFLPFQPYERISAKDGRRGKRLAEEHPYYDLVSCEPNPEMTSITMRKTMQAHALLWGNAYAELQRDASNRVVAIWPRNPARTRPYRINNKLVYKTTEGMSEVSSPDGLNEGNAPERVIDSGDMVHIPGLALDGRLGQSAIYLSRQAVGLALATEKFGAKFFGNGAHGSGILTHPGRLTAEAREQAKRSFQEAQGGENQLRTLLLEQGISFTPLTVAPDNAQFLETRKFQVAEVCRIFGVPPHMIADTEKQNRANVEQIGLEFVTFTLGPWLEAWQQEFKRKLFPASSGAGRPQKKFFLLFETRKLTMPDAQSRQMYYNSGKQWGWLSTNDINELEGRNPVDDPAADALWMPINMEEMGAEDDPADGGDAQDQPPAGKQKTQDKTAQRFARSYLRLFTDAIGRVLSRPKPTSEEFRRAFLPVLGTVGERLSEMAAVEFRCDPPEIAQSKFLADYVEGLRGRAEQWRAENIHLFAEGELNRAVKALLIEVYRQAGTARAKQLAAAQPEIQEA